MTYTKKFTGADFPSDQEGFVKAVISTFDIIDRDGDVVTAGAIPDGSEVKLCAWGHNWGTLPVGKGVINIVGNQAIFTGKFFLDTDAGIQTYKTVKNLDSIQEWSWGFKVKEFKYGDMDGQRVKFILATEPYEVSPVLVGANQETGTLEIKSANQVEEDAIDRTEIDSLDELEVKSDEEVAVTSSESTIETETAEVEVEVEEKADTPDPDASEDSAEISEATAVIAGIKQLLAHTAMAEDSTSRDLSGLICALSDLEWFVRLANDEDGMYMWYSVNQDNYNKKHPDSVIESQQNDENTASKETNNVQYVVQGANLLDDLTAFINRTKSLADLRKKSGRELGVKAKDTLAALKESLTASIAEIDDFIGKSDEIEDSSISKATTESEETVAEITDTPTEEVIEEKSVDQAAIIRRKRNMEILARLAKLED